MSDEYREPTWWKIVDAVSKLAIPILIAYFAYSQAIAIASLENAHREAESDRVDRQASVDVDLRLVELVWEGLNSEAEAERSRALALVETFKPELRIRLAAVISEDESQTEEVRTRANEVREEAASEILANYKIDVYYPEENAELANRIGEWLEKGGGARQVVLASREPSWLTRVSETHRGFELRYHRATEAAVARDLLSRLSAEFPGIEFSLRATRTPTPGMLSLVLFEGSSSVQSAQPSAEADG